nr:putative capsid protein [Crucivirus sp.]
MPQRRRPAPAYPSLSNRRHVRRPAPSKATVNRAYIAGRADQATADQSRSRVPRYGKYLGGAAGTALAPFIAPYAPMLAAAAPAAGAYLGDQAQKLVKYVTGWGDYKIGVNSLIKSADSVPEFKNTGSSRCTMIRHKEFIGDVIGGALVSSASVFTIDTFPIQPGNSTTFPWLSKIAANYEQYRFHGLLFHYKTSSGVVSTTPMLGTTVMATQYNSLSNPFQNKQEMENYEFAGSTVPSRNLIHPVECDPRQTQCNGIFNIQSAQNAYGGDKRLYDLGDFSIATIGLPQASEVVGELWVTYDVCLMKPRLVPSGGSNADHWYGTGIGVNNTSNWLGTDLALSINSDGFTTTDNASKIFFNKNFYGVVSVYYGVISAVTTTPVCPGIVGSNGVTDYNMLRVVNGNNTQASYNSIFNNSQTAFYYTSWFRVQPLSNGTIPTLTFSSGTTGTLSFIDIVIVQQPSDFS